MSDLVLPDSGSPFDALREVDERGEFWRARNLMRPLGYVKWERFEDVVDRARVAIQNSGMDSDEHASRLREASGRTERTDYRLTRYGAYMVAMSGDARKPAIGNALTYFAVKAREAEVLQQFDELTVARKYVAALEAGEELKARALTAEAKVAELEPRAANYDAFLSTKSTQRMDIVAKQFDTTAVKLFAVLRDEGVLMEGGRRHNVPYAKYQEHFKIVAQTYETRSHGTQSTSTTYVRPSGYDLIRRILERRARREEIEAQHRRELGEAS